MNKTSGVACILKVRLLHGSEAIRWELLPLLLGSGRGDSADTDQLSHYDGIPERGKTSVIGARQAAPDLLKMVSEGEDGKASFLKMGKSGDQY